MPVTKGEAKVSPLKVNYIELLNIVNEPDFDLTKAADVIGRDTALVISLLKMVNHMTVNSEITSIRHAAAMLGQKELKKWINTAVTSQLCADRPMRLCVFPCSGRNSQRIWQLYSKWAVRQESCS